MYLLGSSGIFGDEFKNIFLHIYIIYKSARFTNRLKMYIFTDWSVKTLSEIETCKQQTWSL